MYVLKANLNIYGLLIEERIVLLVLRILLMLMRPLITISVKLQFTS